METWVLFIWLAYPGNGVGIATQEFTSELRCKEAALAVHAEVQTNGNMLISAPRVRYVCTRK